MSSFNLNEYQTFIISLPQAIHRRSKMKKALEKAGMNNFIFFDAAYGNALLKEQIETVFSPLVSVAGHPNVYGCAFSHVQIWQRITKLTAKQPYLVLEDDVHLADNFQEESIKCLRLTPAHFDILYLGGIQNELDDNVSIPLKCLHWLTGFGKPKCQWINSRIYQPRVVLGTHAYFITPEGAQKLLDYLVGRIYTHIDYMIMTVPHLNFYATHPFLANQSVTLQLSGIATPTQFPFYINRKLDEWQQHRSGVSWGYVTNTPLSQLSGECINLWTAIFILMGVVLCFTCKSPYNIIIACLVWFTLDILIEAVFYRNTHFDMKSLRSVIFSFLLLLSPAILYLPAV